MKLSLHKRPDSLLIEACELAPRQSGVAHNQSQRGVARYRIRIANVWYRQNLIVTPQGVQLWEVDDGGALALADFQRLADLEQEVVILGLGNPAQCKRLGLPPPAVTQPLMRKRIGLETMDTAAACRTYNALVGDGRRAAAALLV